MTKIGDDSLGWNANGNLNNSVAASFTYDWNNKLRFATAGSNSIEIRYDVRGNRIYKSVDDGINVTERKYIVDIVGKLPVILCEVDPNDSSLTNKYYYANSQILAQDAYTSAEPNNIEAERYFYLHDRLGSIRQIVDCNALTVATYTFNPYGEDFQSECVETIYNPFKYTGQWYDAEISQYYLRARQYDPKMMRFSGRDPVKGKARNPLTLHSYLYCGNEPVDRADPSGRIWGFADMLFTSAMNAQLRKADYKIHKGILDRTKGMMDAFSQINLQRGMVMDFMVADHDRGLKNTLRDGGIASLGLLSDNFSRYAGYLGHATTVWDNKDDLADLFKGEADSDDIYKLTGAIIDTLVGAAI